MPLNMRHWRLSRFSGIAKQMYHNRTMLFLQCFAQAMSNNRIAKDVIEFTLSPCGV